MSASICCSGLLSSSSSGIMAHDLATGEHGEEGSRPACAWLKQQQQQQ
jgi:hypothetical protein